MMTTTMTIMLMMFLSYIQNDFRDGVIALSILKIESCKTETQGDYGMSNSFKSH